MIKRIAGRYVVLSETTGRRMGEYRTKKEALARLRQIEFFSAKGGSLPAGRRGASGGKHLKKSPALRAGLKKKSLI